MATNLFPCTALVALAFEAAYFTFFFTAQVEGDQCTSVLGQPAGCGPIDNSDHDFKVIDVAVGRDAINPLTLSTVDIPPSGSVLNAFVWCATSLAIGLIAAALHVIPACRPSPKALLLTAALNFVTVIPAFSYMAKTSYTSDGVTVELCPSFTWGPGMNLGATLTLLLLVIYDFTLLQAAPGATSATKNVDIEANSGDAAAEVSTTKPKAKVASAKGKKAEPSNAKKPAPKYNADAVSSA